MNTKIDFIKGNTKQCLTAMVLPLMAAMFLNMAYNLVDSLWIGNLLGETAYAALTNSTPVILILSSVAMGATNGVTILLSQAIGAGDKEKTDRLIVTSLVSAVIFSLGVTVLAEAALNPILILLNTPEEVMPFARQYLAIYLLGYLAVYLYCYFTAVLRSFGNSVFQVAAMLICTLLNAALDPLFIHFMGFNGAAVATVLSQTLCLIFMLLYLYKKQLLNLHLPLFNKKFIPSFIYYKRGSFCFSAEYSCNKYKFSHFSCDRIWYYRISRVWNYRGTGNNLILSGNGFKYGTHKYCRPVRRWKKI